MKGTNDFAVDHIPIGERRRSVRAGIVDDGIAVLNAENRHWRSVLPIDAKTAIVRDVLNATQADQRVSFAPFVVAQG